MPVNPGNQDAQYYEAQYIGFRVEKAATTTPQGVDAAKFTITGGRVMLTSIVGEVTVVIASGANNMKLKFNPTATGADQDLCATLDIVSDPVGELYTITGIVANAMRSDLLIGQGMTNPLILSEGDIEVDNSGSTAGEIKWTVHYLPLDDGAVLVAA